MTSAAEEYRRAQSHRETGRFAGPLRVKDISDWLKILLIIGGFFLGYQRLMDRIDAYGTTLDRLDKQSARIERYLSSKDPDYYPKVKQLEEP